MAGIDWTDQHCMVTEHFSVKDCLWLPQWNRLANPEDGLNDEIKRSLMALCVIMEQVRAYLGCPVNVHNMYRSPEYSVKVGGFMHDVHTLGEAIDFDCLPHKSCEAVKQLMLLKLDVFHLRMENNGQGNWIHLDQHPVVNKRFFTP